MANRLTKDKRLRYASRYVVAWVIVGLITWFAVTVWAIQYCVVIPGIYLAKFLGMTMLALILIFHRRAYSYSSRPRRRIWQPWPAWPADRFWWRLNQYLAGERWR